MRDTERHQNLNFLVMTRIIKLFLSSAIFLILTFGTNIITAQSISLTSPSGGGSYNVLSRIAVTWQSKDLSSNVTIELFNGKSMVEAVASNTSNDGIQTIAIPNVPAGSDYSLRIRSTADELINDFSDPFSITTETAAEDFVLTNPLGGESYASSEKVEITWKSSFSGNVKIELIQETNVEQVLASSTTDDGSHTIQFPILKNTASNFAIRLINLEDPTITAISGQFTIVQQDFIQVYSPSTNDKIYINNAHPINWDSNIAGDVQIDLYQNDILITTVLKATPNDNTETIIIPNSISADTNYKLRISSLTNTSVTADSDLFELVNGNAGGISTDLVVQNAGTASPIENIYFVSGISVANVGSTASSSTYSVGAYLSRDRTITTSDFRVGTIGTYSRTPSGDSETGIVSFDVTTLGIPDGTYYFGIIADEFNTEAEEYEDNNSAALSSPQVNVVSKNNSQGADCGILSTAEINEGFESGLGNWTQSGADDMDWIRTENRTPSNLTGPDQASEGNYYLYTEASGGNRLNSARIVSNCIDLSGTSNPVFNFDYHMYGASTGSLQAIVRNESGQSSVVFYQAGNQGNDWHKASIDLSSYIDNTISIEIEATIGVSYSSDMAIDNINVVDNKECSLAQRPCDDGDPCTVGETFDNECNCIGGVYTDLDEDGQCAGLDVDDSDPCVPVVTDACNTCELTLTYELEETFEAGLGNWKQPTSNENNWIVGQGSTPSTRTGPSRALFGLQYMYVEASHGGFPFKEAKINSVCIDLETITNPYLTFSYNMYGSSMGSLNAYIINMETDERNMVFSKSGDQGEQWKVVEIDLSDFGDKTVQIQFEAITGFGFRSDIAIDGVFVHEFVPSFTNTPQPETRNYVEAIHEKIEINSEDLNIFPIPASEFFFIEFATSDEVKNANLSIINTSGKLIKNENVALKNGFIEQKIDISNVPAGTYFVSLQTESDRITKQISIAK